MTPELELGRADTVLRPSDSQVLLIMIGSCWFELQIDRYHAQREKKSPSRRTPMQ